MGQAPRLVEQDRPRPRCTHLQPSSVFWPSSGRLWARREERCSEDTGRAGVQTTQVFISFLEMLFSRPHRRMFAVRAADGPETGWELGAGGTHPRSPRDSFEAKNIVNGKNSLTNKEAALAL